MIFSVYIVKTKIKVRESKKLEDKEDRLNNEMIVQKLNTFGRYNIPGKYYLSLIKVSEKVQVFFPKLSRIINGFSDREANFILHDNE